MPFVLNLESESTLLSVEASDDLKVCELYRQIVVWQSKICLCPLISIVACMRKDEKMLLTKDASHQSGISGPVLRIGCI